MLQSDRTLIGEKICAEVFKKPCLLDDLAHLIEHTVDPDVGEIVPINDNDKVYFDKMTI
jgi:hypothetical protein